MGSDLVERAAPAEVFCVVTNDGDHIEFAGKRRVAAEAVAGDRGSAHVVRYVLPTAEPKRADVATLERVRERLRGLYDETSPHNATASRMLFVIDDMLTEARAQPAAVSEPSFYPFGTAVRVPRVDLGNVSLEAAAEGEWTGGDPIAAAIVARAKQAEAQAHETADLLVAMQRRAERAESETDALRANAVEAVDVLATATRYSGNRGAHALVVVAQAAMAKLQKAEAEVERLKAELNRAVTAPCNVEAEPVPRITQSDVDTARAMTGSDPRRQRLQFLGKDAQLKPVRWDDVEGLCKVAWYATEVMASWEMLSDREREERRTEMRAVLSALARALLTEGALDAFVGAVIREPDRDITNLVTAGAGMRAALAHAGANVEAEPVAEGRACPWDDRRDNIRAAIRMVHQANEPHSSAIHGVTIALEQLALAVDEVRRLGGGGR